MEFSEVVKSRRSIRKYKGNTTVDREVLEEIIKFAQYAPSWKNSQTGRYYIVTSSEKLAKVKEECLPEFNCKNCDKAPVLVVATYVMNRAGFEKDGTLTNELGNQWGAYDLGLQNQNLLLKAKEMGLDTLVMGIRNAEKLREILSIPESEQVVSVISLGYGDIHPEMPKRREISEIAKFF